MKVKTMKIQTMDNKIIMKILNVIIIMKTKKTTQKKKMKMQEKEKKFEQRKQPV